MITESEYDGQKNPHKSHETDLFFSRWSNTDDIKRAGYKMAMAPRKVYKLLLN